jgi:hypothetical protein
MSDSGNSTRSGNPAAPGNTSIDDLEKLWNASDDDLPYHILRRDDLGTGLCGRTRTRPSESIVPRREVPEDRRCPECEVIYGWYQ